MVANGIVNTAEVFLARESYDAGDFGFGLLWAGSGVGLVVGGLAASSLMKRDIAVAYTRTLGLFALGIAGAAAAPNVWLGVVAMMVAGFGNGGAVVANITLVQQGAQDRVRGRVFTLLMSVNYAVLGVAFIIAGPITDAMGARWAYAAASVVIVGALVAAWLILPRSELHAAPVPQDGTRPRKPRGVLVVPMLADPVSDEPSAGARDALPAPAHSEAASSTLPRPPVVPVMVPAQSGGRGSRPFWGAVVVALLVLLAAAGILGGRALRGGDDAVTPTTSPSTPTLTRPKVVSPTPTEPPAWGPLTAEPVGQLALPLEGAAAAVVGRRLVVLGGRSSGEPTAAVLLGAPDGVVPRVASLPSPLAEGVPLVQPGAVYVIGGERGETVTDEIVRFDLSTRAMTSVGRFVEPLAGAGHVQVDDSVVIVGGWTGEKLATGVLRYSLDGSPTLVARLPEATRDPAVALLGDRIYVAGGLTAAGPSKNVYAVELASGTVTLVGELARAVSSAVLVVSGGQLYLLGGRAAAGPVATVTRIDPRTGAITAAGRMPRPLAGAEAVRLGGATLVVGGLNHPGAGGTSTAIDRLSG